MTDDELSTWEAQAAAATPGPWFLADGDDSSCMTLIGVATGSNIEGVPEEVVCLTLLQDPKMATHSSGLWDENAIFIASARTAVPALIAEVRRLRQLLAEKTPR